MPKSPQPVVGEGGIQAQGCLAPEVLTGSVGKMNEMTHVRQPNAWRTW